MTTFTIVTRNYDSLFRATLDYFECEKSGRNSTCSRNNDLHHATVSIMTFLLLGLFPAVNLMFAVNIRDVKTLLNLIKSKSKSLKFFGTNCTESV